jgi:hypothetical protein
MRVESGTFDQPEKSSEFETMDVEEELDAVIAVYGDDVLVNGESDEGGRVILVRWEQSCWIWIVKFLLGWLEEAASSSTFSAPFPRVTGCSNALPASSRTPRPRQFLGADYEFLHAASNLSSIPPNLQSNFDSEMPVCAKCGRLNPDVAGHEELIHASLCARVTLKNGYPSSSPPGWCTLLPILPKRRADPDAAMTMIGVFHQAKQECGSLFLFSALVICH